MITIETVNAQDLPLELQEECGVEDWDYENYLIVKRGEVTIFIQSDYMEPEDASFNRDLSWVPVLLQKMYDEGLYDGIHAPPAEESEGARTTGSL